MKSDKDSRKLTTGLGRRDFMRLVAGGAATAGVASSPLISSCGRADASTKKKVVVLGMDGLDPKIIKMLIDNGRAPNFKKIARMGAFKALTTTMPALSPVAWSSFITGLTPGGHGVTDFVVRDLETYKPVFSIFEFRDPDITLPLGDLVLPIAGGGPQNMRSGKPFWSYLTERGIPATVIRIPTNFPVEDTATRAISGMGTPGIASTYGMFNYYTTDYFEEYPNITGGRVHYVDNRDGVVEANLIGPPNAFVQSSRKGDEPFENYVKVPFKVYIDKRNDAARIEIQGKTIVLKKGEFSEWVSLDFESVPLLPGMTGIVHFMLKQAHPHVKLYVSPVNVDPEKQSLPITHPEEYGKELVQKIGYFASKLLPVDTKALDYRIFSDEDYVKQAQKILQEQIAQFDYEWSRFKSGLFYFYVSNTDQDAHMMWRNMDPTHPMHKAGDPRFSDYIFYLYEEMDKLVGKVLPAIDDDTLVLVCSDHGFAQFGRMFHLNTWLRRQGYLVVKPGAESKPKTSLFDIDWSRTVAYAMGFNGLYINLKGREAQGIVEPEQAGKYVKRISAELAKVVDDETGVRPVAQVFDRDKLNTGPHTANMAEMLVGYTPGYRNSGDSFIGETGSKLIEVNPWAWSGDHSMAFPMVPGSLFSSRKVKKPDPTLYDLPVSILDFFGISKPAQMVGKSIFKA